MKINLLKNFSSHPHRDVNIPIPPCASLSDDSNDRLAGVCRDHASTYREVLEKYHESVFTVAEEQLRKSQDRQMQQLKKLMEKETSEVMRQLQHSRKSEVKQLALVHKDKDELERMKREVDSTLVEKGVAERVRLTASYERRRDDLQKQHEAVRTTLNDQKDKVRVEKASRIFREKFQLNFLHTDQSHAREGCEQSGVCLFGVVHEFLQRPHSPNLREQRQLIDRHISCQRSSSEYKLL